MITELYDKDEQKRRQNALLDKARQGNWWRMRESKSKRRPSPEEIYKVIEEVAEVSLARAAFMALLYLSGCRCEEITRYKRRRSKNNPTDIDFYSILLSNISQVVQDDELCVQIRNRILKMRGEVYAENKIIAYSENTTDWPFFQILDDYITQNNFVSGSELFPYSYYWGRSAVVKYFGVSPHVFRNWRSKSLIEDFGFSPQDLQVWMGWKTSDMAMKYSSGSKFSIIDRYKKLKANI